jgi:carbamate kinase
VALDFGKPAQRNVAQMTAAEARQRMAEGHFAPGSMKPKIEASIRFVEQSENPRAYALITNPENLGRALQGATGTRIVRA